MDDPRDKHFAPPEKPRRLWPGYDVLWKRASQAVGVVIAVAEWVSAQAMGRPVDQNVLLFAAMLIGVPFAAGRGDPK